MRSGAPDELLAGFVQWTPQMASWKNGTLLADDIPIVGGRITWSRSQRVPEILTVEVPRFDGGTDYHPGHDPDHPLARFGQQLAVKVTVRSQLASMDYETRLGMFAIQDSKDAGDTIRVTAKGVLQPVDDARLIVPLAPRVGGTLKSEFRRLLPPGVIAGFDAELVDRPCPRSFEWAEDRLGALYDIANAWPARILADGIGQLLVLPPLADVATPITTLRDGEGGTLVGKTMSDTREGAYNVVVARSSAIDDPQQAPIQAVSSTTSGPMAVDVYGEVPTFYSSPLIGSVAQAQKAADKLRASALRPSRTIPVEIVPDPRLELDDPVAVLSDYLPSTQLWQFQERGYIVGIDMPLTADGNPMRVDVGVG